MKCFHLNSKFTGFVYLHFVSKYICNKHKSFLLFVWCVHYIMLTQRLDKAGQTSKHQVISNAKVTHSRLSAGPWSQNESWIRLLSAFGISRWLIYRGSCCCVKNTLNGSTFLRYLWMALQWLSSAIMDVLERLELVTSTTMHAFFNGRLLNRS